MESNTTDSTHASPILVKVAPQVRRKKATVAQQISLESYFLINSNPNLTQREILAKEVGINEKSLQIWYQNRRAKNRSLGKPSTISVEKNLQHRFSVDAIQVGQWTRACIMNDLLCFSRPENNALHWELIENTIIYRITCQLTQIKNIEFSMLPDLLNGKISFCLTSVPQFQYKMNQNDEYRECGDFTANQQASQCLRHDLFGIGSILKNEFMMFVNGANLHHVARDLTGSSINPDTSQTHLIEKTQMTHGLPIFDQGNHSFLNRPCTPIHTLDLPGKALGSLVHRRSSSICSDSKFPHIHPRSSDKSELVMNSGPVRNRRLSQIFGLPVTPTSDYFTEMLSNIHKHTHFNRYRFTFI